MKGTVVFLPKTLYALKPLVYTICGFSLLAFATAPIVKVAGLVLGVMGLGFTLNRLAQPLDEK